MACSPSRREEAPERESSSSRVDVYLGCSDAGPRPLMLEFASVELRTREGVLHPLVLAQSRVRSSELARRVPLAGSGAPPAQYEALVLRVTQAWLAGPDGEVALRLVAGSAAGEPPEPVPPEGLACELPLQLRLDRHEAAVLFVDWRGADSLRGGADFAPAFSLTSEKRRATLGLLYVADAAAGSVLTVDRSTEEVVATIKVGAEPRALALSRDRRRLYVANAGDGSLGIVDLRQGLCEATLPIGLTARTWDVALADGDRLVAVTNRDSDELLLVDGALGSRLQKIALGRAPTRLAAAPLLGRLFVLESASDGVDAIDLASRQAVGRLPTESRPSDIALDRSERELYIVHAGSPNLLVADARTLARAATIFVGADASVVLADRRRDRIYVARTNPRELVVIERRLGSVVRRIPLSGRVEALAQPLDGAWIYAASPERGSLLVIDVVLGREEPPIRCGKRPTDVLVAD